MKMRIENVVRDCKKRALQFAPRGFAMWVLLLAILASDAAANANFLLKPNGQNAAPLRRKTLKADVEIRGGVASVSQIMTFANESSARIEADFILTAPKGAVITYFAYWYEKEKVVARVVEKERAAQIYQYITSRMRDPALIEMIGKNTFRARIFPIEPNADLRVEIHMIQTLSSTRSGSNFKLELKPAKAGTGTLEKLDVRVSVAESGAQKVVNNFNLPITQNGGERVFTFSRNNYRPDRDLNIALVQAPRAISTSATAARSGGSDGFFALNISARETLRRPRIAISGIQTYDVVAPRVGRLRAFDSWMVSGRYRGQGVALVTVLGVNERGQQRRYVFKVPMTSRREDNNVATKLWASGRIAQLSARKKNRAAVVALSTRYTLPSKYTSWLAIPQAERVRYAQEKAQADFDTYSRQAILSVRKSGANSPQTKALRARFETAAKAVNRDAKGEWNLQLGLAIVPLQERLNGEKARRKPRRRVVSALQSDIRQLERAGGINPYGATEEGFTVDQELVRLKREVKQRNNGRRARVLKTRIARLEKRRQRLTDAPAPPNSYVGGGGGGFRTGDPLIEVEAPADALGVTALLPEGIVKKLLFNAQSRKWEARFDIPTHATEGEYSITIVVLRKDGSRTNWTLRYRVDMTAPSGQGAAQIVGANSARTLRLELQAGGDTTRVSALLPWGEKVDLAPSKTRAKTFFALVALPASLLRTANSNDIRVTYILTDGAHNRTSITVDNAQ